MTEEETVVERTATGTWTDGTEIAMSINVVTESGTAMTANDEEAGTANGGDMTEDASYGTITPFVRTDPCGRSMLPL